MAQLSLSALPYGLHVRFCQDGSVRYLISRHSRRLHRDYKILPDVSFANSQTNTVYFEHVNIPDCWRADVNSRNRVAIALSMFLCCSFV